MVIINRQAVGWGAEICLCFQPRLLRLISVPAATVGAPVPHTTQHPGLDQSTIDSGLELGGQETY